MLHSKFGDLAHIVVALLITKTGETQRRLTTTTMLLWKVDGKFLNYFTGISREDAEK